MKWLPSAVVLLLTSYGQLGAAELILTGSEVLGCREIRGTHVAFLAPARGIVFLATREFPGGRQVGSVHDGRLTADVPGYGPLEVAAGDSAAGIAVWGMLDVSLEIADQRGCFGFGPRRFSDVDDLKTYMHWFVRHVLELLPEVPRQPANAVWLGGRKVTLEIGSASHEPLLLRGTEGTTLALQPVLQPGGVARRFYFQVFVLGRAADRAAVRVSVKEGDFFGPGTVEDIGFFVIGPDEPTFVPTEPPIELRLKDIEASVLAGRSQCGAPPSGLYVTSTDPVFR